MSNEPGRRPAFRQAWSHAIAGGLPGYFAQAAQVTSLMWLHTSLNYQYKHGTSLRQSLSTLWAEGGARRLYRFEPVKGLMQGGLLCKEMTSAEHGGFCLAFATHVCITCQRPVFTCRSGASEHCMVT